MLNWDSKHARATIELYSCTENGVFYALSLAKESDLFKILEAEKDKFDTIKYFISEYERMGEKDFISRALS
jgi:hypothetical protein